MPTRRANHEGTYESKADPQNPKAKKWRLVKEVDRRRKHGPWSSTKAKALDAWKEKWNKPEAKVTPPGEKTLNAILSEKFTGPWVAELAPTTLDSYLRTWETAIEKDPLGSMQISAIEKDHVIEWRSSCLSAGIGIPTVIKAMVVLGRVLKEEGNGVMSLVKPPQYSPKTKHVIKPSETLEISARVHTPRTKLAILLMMEGMSRGEIAGLHFEQIDDDGTITIDRQAVEVNGVVSMRYKLKSKNRYRSIQIPDAAREILAELRAAAKSPMIFPGEPGKGRKKDRKAKKEALPMHPTALTRMVARALKGTIFERVRPHALRAAFATHLLEARVDVRTAAEMLGHDPAVLVRIYAQSRPELKKAASDQVAALRNPPQELTLVEAKAS